MRDDLVDRVMDLLIVLHGFDQEPSRTISQDEIQVFLQHRRLECRLSCVWQVLHDPGRIKSQLGWAEYIEEQNQVQILIEGHLVRQLKVLYPAALPQAKERDHLILRDFLGFRLV